jgi:hypothetical protein
MKLNGQLKALAVLPQANASWHPRAGQEFAVTVVDPS